MTEMTTTIENEAEFENRLIEAAKELLGANAQVLTNLPLWDEAKQEAPWRPDLAFIPSHGPRAGQPHIVEFKFFRVAMVPPTIVVKWLGRFERINQANSERGLRFAFVTNSAIELEFIGRSILPNIALFGGVSNERIWQMLLRNWVDAV